MTPLAPDLWLWEGQEDSQARQELVRAHLAGLVGCPPAELHLTRDAMGRPHIAAPDCGLHFSLARRGGMMVMAVSREGLVGVDLEVPTPDGDWPEAVAKDFFAPAEYRWLRGLPKAERGAAFLRLWTAKEAVLKALGLGIAQGMAEPCLTGLDLAAEEIQSLQAHGRHFSLRWLPLKDGLICLARATV